MARPRIVFWWAFVLMLILGSVAYYFATKKKEVPVQITEMISPQENIWNRANLEFIPPDKRYRVYPYRLRFPDGIDIFTFSVDFDVKAYREAHPEDVVLIEYDEYLARVIEVYSVSDTLDGRFFDKDDDGNVIAYE